MNASWAELPGRHILAFRFRYIPVNERQLSRVAREAHSGVPFPPPLGKRTPVARVAHPCRSRTGLRTPARAAGKRKTTNPAPSKIGRASCRERVSISEV